MGAAVFGPYGAMHKLHRLLHDRHAQAAAIGGVAPGFVGAVENLEESGKRFRRDAGAIVSADEDDPAVLAGQGDGKCALRFLFIFQAVGGCIHKNAGYEEAVSFHEDVFITQGYFQCQSLLSE